MTREDIKACCKKISPGYNEDSVCDFADNVQTLGFIDTSQGQNGSRGIVFSTNHMMLNTDGTLRIIFYRNITDVRIIDSYEDAFSDELEIVCAGEEFRVSNCSLNKTELKALLDELCEGGLRGEGPARITPPPPKPPANTIAVTATPTTPAVSVTPVPKSESAVDLLRKAPEVISPNGNTQSEPLNNDEVKPSDDRQTEQPESGAVLRQERQSEASVNDEAKQREDKQTEDHEKTGNDITPQEKREDEASENEGVRQREDKQTENHKKTGNDITPHEEQQSGASENDKEHVEAPPNDDDIIFESDTPVIFEKVTDRKSSRQKPPEPPKDDDDDINNTEERLKIQNMTTEETMSFLAQSLSEINAPFFEDTEPILKPGQKLDLKPEPKTIPKPEPRSELKLEPKPESVPEPVQRVREAPPATIKDYNPLMPEVPQKPKGLTEEPVWGDIYIKASRNLRELCESNKLSMKAIETELHDKLLESTKAFAEITADESRVPKVLIPKITELKAAAQNFDQYFQLGEDIAVRAMFFMLYQMLSYSDRIVETPETKEGLNDFFRRFGPAGIMLSMLDMRV